MTDRRTFALLLDYYGGEYQLGLLRGAEAAATQYDINLVYVVGRWLNAPKPMDAVQNDIYRHLRKPGVDGVIVASGCLTHYVTQTELREFCDGFMPLPVLSVSVQVPGISSLVVNNRQAQRQIVEHLIECHQCRRIAYISGPVSSFEAKERLAGYRDALRSHQIEFDPLLVRSGNYWIDSGVRCVSELMNAKIPFDGLVAANDFMALGAQDTMKKCGLCVPKDVKVVGFDDVSTARMASPSLTTVRQPLWRMGHLAVELLGRKLDGERLDELYYVDVELVQRQSCGCSLGATAENVSKLQLRLSAPTVEALRASRARLERRLLDAVIIPNDCWPKVVTHLVSALLDELEGVPERFLRVLAELLEQNQSDSEVLEQFYNVIEVLRCEFRDYFRGNGAFEDECHSATLMVGEWVGRAYSRAIVEQSAASNNLHASIERLSTTLTRTALSEALSAILPTTAIRSACFSVYEDDSAERLRVFSVTGVAANAKLYGALFDAAQLAPAGFIPSEHRNSYVLMPLSNGTTRYGQALLEGGDVCSVYSMLREQIGAALKAAELHGTVVEETARRERAERERLERETEIAEQIQTAILPKRFDVPGLEIAAFMRPATTVGGDYYDVISTDDGCFIGIGDVTGHGLLAGIIMLMVQSMVAATVRANADRSPSQLLPTLNRTLYSNIQERLRGSDYVTFTLIKYRKDGKLELAGAHEDPLLFRRRTGRCERLKTPGFWLAAVEDVSAVTTDLEAQLEDGDVLVLYTDGITESMNETHSQFGLERLVAVIERHGTDSPGKICDAIVLSLTAWSTTQMDDVSLLVAKYAASTRAAEI